MSNPETEPRRVYNKSAGRDMTSEEWNEHTGQSSQSPLEFTQGPAQSTRAVVPPAPIQSSYGPTYATVPAPAPMQSSYGPTYVTVPAPAPMQSSYGPTYATLPAPAPMQSSYGPTYATLPAPAPMQSSYGPIYATVPASATRTLYYTTGMKAGRAMSPPDYKLAFEIGGKDDGDDEILWRNSPDNHTPTWPNFPSWESRHTQIKRDREDLASGREKADKVKLWNQKSKEKERRKWEARR